MVRSTRDRILPAIFAASCLCCGLAGLVAGEKYAFLVGVADYDRKELKPLQFTRSDILEMHDVLVDAGYRKANIVLMHDDLKQLSNRRYFPEAAKIRAELKLLLAGLEKDDTLIVAFSGHGVQFKGQKQNYFCPADAKLDDAASLISLSELYVSLEKCPAGQKLLLVDACRDDPQSQLSKARQTVEVESVTRPQTEAVPEGLVALFSCAEGQRSFEDPELKHGVFFYHVLEGLKGAARNEDSEITLDDLVSFTRKRTQSFARASLAAIQTPQQRGEFSGTWVLRSVKSAPIDPKKPIVTKPPMRIDPKKPIAVVPNSGALGIGLDAGEEWNGNRLKMRFCWCPEGRFAMGSPPDEPVREDDETQVLVNLKGFWMGKHEVTQAEWKAVVGTSVAQLRAKEKSTDKFEGEGPDFPMVFVSYDDAKSFCETLTRIELDEGRLPRGWEYRLPTEAQWEYACRAGTKTPTAFGESLSSRQANFHGDHPYNGAEKGPNLGKAAEVGQYPPNAWGLCDMHGNVGEWCGDSYRETLTAGSDPEFSKPNSFRVYRGGGWRNDGRGCRSARRPWNEQTFRSDSLGFRVALVRLGR